jgi:hypothetical protein
MHSDLPHIDVPAPLRDAIASGGQDLHLNGWAYEALAADAYRRGLIGLPVLRRLLHLSFYEGEQFLAEHNLFYQYDMNDLESDRAAMKEIIRQ